MRKTQNNEIHNQAMLGQTSLLAYRDNRIHQNLLRRHALMQSIRMHLTHKDFVEVDTPLIRHWETPYISLGIINGTTLHLRAAPEDYVRRCACAFGKAFEIGKCFRNEDIAQCTDRQIRLPEFSMVEMYEVDIDLNGALERMEILLNAIVQNVMGDEHLIYQDKVLDFEVPFQRIKVLDAIDQYGDYNAKHFAKIHKTAEPLLVQGEDGVLEELLDKHVKPNLFNPTFLTHFPKSADQYPDHSVDNEVYRAELIIANIEIGEVGSLQHDVDILEKHMQLKMDSQHNNTKTKINGLQEEQSNFLAEIRAFNRHVAGGGFGLDRFLMLLCNTTDIRDVVWYPSWVVGRNYKAIEMDVVL